MPHKKGTITVGGEFPRGCQKLATSAGLAHPNKNKSKKWLQHPRGLGSPNRTVNPLEPLRGFQHPRSS